VENVTIAQNTLERTRPMWGSEG